ncbi:MAG: hypothetical protein NTY90_00450 [Candidatus Micrarchaeota archaeon]|nr:hypothetical protein [Candidatus Micrarchaeota archaeon]
MTRVQLDEYVAEQPVFARVRERGEHPPMGLRVAGYEFGRLGGIPIVHKGYARVTYRYLVELFCDVCGRGVECKKTVYGLPGEVPRTEAEEMMADEKRVKRAALAGRDVAAPARDRELVKNLAREINFSKCFRFQCPRCGRWAGKGREHAACVDERFGLCRFCGNAMGKLFEKGKG